MKELIIVPGENISPDEGLSDVFKVRTIDDAGDPVLFDFDPREWLAEWELVRRAQLPVGATYSRQLWICASHFTVHFPLDPKGKRRWQFTVFDIQSRTERKLTLSDQEVTSLAGEVRRYLDD